MVDNFNFTEGSGKSGAAKDIAGVLYPEVINVETDGSATGLSAKLGSLTETAPTTDTASSGLNGRLQRVAQRLTSLIALFPTLVSGRWPVDGSAVTQPISAASLPLPTGAATETTLSSRLSESDFDTKIGSLTETAPASDTASSGVNGRLQRIAQRITTLISSTLATSIADGANTTLGAKADNKSSATDTTAITIMSVLKQISFSIQAAASSLAGTLTVATHAVTQSGNWTARIVGNSGAVLDGVNTAATAPANGILGLGIYNSTEPSPTTGQSVGLQLDSKGRLRLVIMDAAGNTRGVNVDASNRLSVSVDNIAASQNIATIGTSVTPGTAAANLGKAEDAAHSTGDVGVMALAVRRATATDLSAGATDGDYEPLQVDANGRLHIIASSGVAGDIAHDGVDSGNPLKTGGQARTTNPTAVSDADRANFITDKLGKQIAVPAIRELKGIQTTTITSSTSETTIVTAAGAGVFADIYRLIVTNTSGTQCKVTIKDATTGTTRYVFDVPAHDSRGFSGDAGSAAIQATANNNWTATCGTSVADIVITAEYVKNT